MANRTLAKICGFGRDAWILVALCCPGFSFAQERTVFRYDVQGYEAKGCFAHVSAKDWVEFTVSGETLAFQEVARNDDFIELFDSSRGGVGVRLFNKNSQWNQLAGTEGKWAALFNGTWIRDVDLRPEFLKYGLTPRLQGSRGTCSVFTTVGTLEFGLARKLGESQVFSVEFSNWASNQVAGDKLDGSFFVDCLDGFRKYGLCREQLMPYEPKYDPNDGPSPIAREEGDALRRQAIDSLRVHWIRPPSNGEPGLTARQFVEVKTVLARGYPVAFGSGHSILLVGYRDNPDAASGGEFLVKDSCRHDFVTSSFEHVKTAPYDVFWVDFHTLPPIQRKQWAYRTGVFKQVDAGNWTELCNNDTSYSFREVERKSDYVELYEQERQLTLRIYGRSFSKMFYKTPDMRKWALLYDGRWVD